MSDPNDRYRPPGSPGRPVDPAPAPVEPAPWGQPAAPTQAPGGYDAQPGPATAAYPPADQPSYAAPQPAPPAAPARRGSRNPIRWIVALVATVLVAGSIGAVALYAGLNATTPSAALAYLPANTAAYYEMRLDLPGDQRQKAGEFLAHFPGFADRTTLDQGVDQFLDRVTKQASRDRYSYTGDVKPWFSGVVSAAMLDLPRMPIPGAGAESPGPDATQVPKVVVVVGVQDRARAQAAIDKIKGDLAGQGVTFSGTARADGTEVVTFGPTGDDAPVHPAYALTSDAVVVAMDVADLNAALDRKAAGTDTLGKDQRFTGDLAKLRGDRVGLVFADWSPMREQLASALPAGSPGSKVLEVVLGKVPMRVVSAFRFESDRLVVDAINHAPSGAPAPPASGDSGLPARAPSDSLFYAEMPEAGTLIRELATALKQDPIMANADEKTQRDIALAEGVLGAKLENFFDWLGNVAVTGGLSDGKVAVGLVGSVKDTTVAAQRLTQLTTAIQFQAADAVTVARSTYAGVELTTIAPAGSAPVPSEVPTSIAFAIKDGVLVFGLGESYVKRLLDLPREQSLAGSQRFADAVKAAGGPATSGLMWADIAAVRALIEEKALTGEARSSYDKEIKPYLVPLDQFVSVGVQDGADQQMHTHLIVK